MRKVGASRQSATPSPSPGSASASMIGGHAMKRAGSGGKSHPLAIYGTLEMTILAGSRVPSRLSMHARDSPTTRSDDSAGPGTPVKSRSLCSLPVRTFHALTQIQPLYLYGPLLAQLPTREHPPSKRLEKPRDQYHDKPPKSRIRPRSGKPDNISWLNQPSGSRPRIPILKLIFLSRTCRPAG
jgi:hypothetical protein